MKINNIGFENLQGNKFHLKQQMGENNDLQLYDRKRRHILVPDREGYVEVNPNGKYDLIRLEAVRTIGCGDGNEYIISKRKQQKDPNAPKLPKSGFLLFCDYIRNKTPGHMKSIGDRMKWIGQKWKTLDLTSKNKFEDMAKKEKIQYGKKVEEYHNRLKKENQDMIIKKEEQ